ncbi:MAG TPA: hypothetical protein VEU55_08515 [Gemmatimonadales bacterium]|nr:hypothetical protein [Gemmatimonadales bacterium]
MRQAARDRLPLVPGPQRLVAENLIDADRVVAGQLEQVEEADEYEPLGGITFGLFGAKVVVPLAYNGTLRVDSTLLGHAASTLAITFFAPRGAVTPQPGQVAIWVLHRRALWRLERCSEQQALTSAACPYDVGLALDSDEDIRPLAEWPTLRDLVRTLELSPPRGAP